MPPYTLELLSEADTAQGSHVEQPGQYSAPSAPGSGLDYR